MSQRDRDARAAMREILRAGLQLAKVADCASLAEMAWSVADAMATERRKREAAEAPTSWPHARDPAADLARAMEHLKTARNEELEDARREGRDAGMREARGRLRAMADENAKLRAVAEAAARLQRWRHSDQVSYAEGEQSDDALMATLDAALPNWRSAP